MLAVLDGTVGAFKACSADAIVSIMIHNYRVTSSILQELGWRWMIFAKNIYRVSYISRCSIAAPLSDKNMESVSKKDTCYPTVSKFPLFFIELFFPFVEMSWDVEFGSWDLEILEVGSPQDAMENLLEHVFRNVLGVEQEDLLAGSAAKVFFLVENDDM